jgi:hypothetical protein
MLFLLGSSPEGPKSASHNRIKLNQNITGVTISGTIPNKLPTELNFASTSKYDAPPNLAIYLTFIKLSIFTSMTAEF